MSERVLTCNEKDTLPLDVARADLLHVLDIARPTIAALEEWGNARNGILDACGLSWARGPKGGGPVLWDEQCHTKRAVKSVRLAFPEVVGHLPGRRDRLGSNYGTEVILDSADGGQTVAIGFHLTAEIEDVRGGGYKKDLAHRLRVMRHKREKRRLGRRARMHRRRGRKVFVLGDTNFSHMPLGGFVNCWEGRGGGSLQGRPVDIVYADRAPQRLQIVKTRSDHDAVVAIY